MRDQAAINEKIRQSHLLRVAAGLHVGGKPFRKGKDKRRAKLTAEIRLKAQEARAAKFAARPFDELSKGSKRKFLIEEFNHTCQKCGNSEWNGLPIALELEHIDGNPKNNSKENLTIFCPNCHAQTTTWRRKKSCFSSSDGAAPPS